MHIFMWYFIEKLIVISYQKSHQAQFYENQVIKGTISNKGNLCLKCVNNARIRH